MLSVLISLLLLPLPSSTDSPKSAMRRVPNMRQAQLLAHMMELCGMHHKLH